MTDLPRDRLDFDIDRIELRARMARKEAMQEMWNGLRRAFRPSR